MMNTKDLTKFWNDQAKDVLEGKTITQVRYLNDKEMEQFGWHKRPVCFFLSDGTQCIISMDDEGNNGGSLFYFTKDEQTDWILPTL